MKYKLKDFIPLILILICTIILTYLISFFQNQLDIKNLMINFMSSFFLIFATFKIINIKNFAQAYAEYDIIAKQIYWYSYFYPFIELFLGFAYLFKWNLFLINIITCILMLINAIGVLIELSKDKIITCACLGLVFKIPMTYVTFIEDIIMAIMALMMMIF